MIFIPWRTPEKTPTNSYNPTNSYKSYKRKRTPSVSFICCTNCEILFGSLPDNNTTIILSFSSILSFIYDPHFHFFMPLCATTRRLPLLPRLPSTCSPHKPRPLPCFLVHHFHILPPLRFCCSHRRTPYLPYIS